MKKLVDGIAFIVQDQMHVTFLCIDQKCRTKTGLCSTLLGYSTGIKTYVMVLRSVALTQRTKRPGGFQIPCMARSDCTKAITKGVDKYLPLLEAVRIFGGNQNQMLRFGADILLHRLDNLALVSKTFCRSRQSYSKHSKL